MADRMVLTPPPPVALVECGDERSLGYPVASVQRCTKEADHGDEWHENVAWSWSATHQGGHQVSRWWVPAEWYEGQVGIDRAPEGLPHG